MAPFPVGSNPRWRPATRHPIDFVFGSQVGCSGSLADLKYKEKERMGSFGEIDKKISREVYTLDWSQSNAFVTNIRQVSLAICITALPVRWQFLVSR